MTLIDAGCPLEELQKTVAALRLRGGGDGVPPQGGGWRELSGPDLRT